MTQDRRHAAKEMPEDFEAPVVGAYQWFDQVFDRTWRQIEEAGNPEHLDKTYARRKLAWVIHLHGFITEGSQMRIDWP